MTFQFSFSNARNIFTAVIHSGWARIALHLPCLLLVSTSLWSAARVVFVARPNGDENLRSQADLASRFYGLDLENLTVARREDGRKVIESLKRVDAVAVLVTAEVLTDLRPREVFKALQRPGRRSVPLLIMGVAPGQPPDQIAKWSGGAVINCGVPLHGSEVWSLKIAKDEAITHELGGITLPFTGEVACGLKLGEGSQGNVIGELSNGDVVLPFFIDCAVSGERVFVMAGAFPGTAPAGRGADKLVGMFANIAPLMMYLRYAAGERAWHTPGHYANLSIDDPWLIEPYGNLNYHGLLREMQKHNFHTTISFIPWNFDRSAADVISLFRNYPDKFSIAIHGNNHDHAEFSDYRGEPPGTQVSNIKQALARMENFKTRTGIPYDAVMVFPHEVAPLGTLAYLKKYNFLATVNSRNVPTGASLPTDPLFLLRPETLAFDNFPSFRRYAAEVPVSAQAIAVHSFLGNPLLFYAHEGIFRKGIGTFDAGADTVNTLEPTVEWRSLGYIVQHSYLLRLRQDQEYDVLALSPGIHLTNPENRRILFHVRKPEAWNHPIRSFTIDGLPLHYDRLESDIAFNVHLEPKQTKYVEIRYLNDLDLAKIAVAKSSTRINALRRISDFRDRVMSRNAFGALLVEAYYAGYLPNLERKVETEILPFISSVVCLLLAWLVHRRRGRVHERRAEKS